MRSGNGNLKHKNGAKKCKKALKTSFLALKQKVLKK